MADPDRVREIIADIGQSLKAEAADGQTILDPIAYLEDDYGRDMSKWPRDALTAFVAMQLGVLPDKTPLHELPADKIVPTLRKAYRSVTG